MTPIEWMVIGIGAVQLAVVMVCLWRIHRRQIVIAQLAKTLDEAMNAVLRARVAKLKEKGKA